MGKNLFGIHKHPKHKSSFSKLSQVTSMPLSHHHHNVGIVPKSSIFDPSLSNPMINPFAARGTEKGKKAGVAIKTLGKAVQFVGGVTDQPELVAAGTGLEIVGDIEQGKSGEELGTAIGRDIGGALGGVLAGAAGGGSSLTRRPRPAPQGRP